MTDNPSLPPPLPEPAPQQELLRSLGSLLRGLSLLFWGIPAALVLCVQTAQTEFLRLFGIMPPLLSTALVLYGLVLIGRFRPGETVWITAVERARLLALVNMGLSPFAYWWSRIPANAFFTAAVEAMALCGLLFLLAIGPVLRRLTAMLPDEVLRHETVVFTRMNTLLLSGTLALVAAMIALHHLRWPLMPSDRVSMILERLGHWGIWFLILLSTAMTMALLWKTKEVIFHSVFGGKT